MSFDLNERGTSNYFEFDFGGINSKKVSKALKKDRYQDKVIEAAELFNRGFIDEGIDMYESIPGFSDISITGRFNGQNLNWD